MTANTGMRRRGMRWLLVIGAIVSLLLAIGLYVMGRLDGVATHDSDLEWERAVDEEYRIDGAERIGSPVGDYITSIAPYLWQERHDPYLLSNNGGYFMFCGVAISMSSDDDIASVPYAGWRGETEAEGAVVVEAYAFELNGVNAADLFHKIEVNATSCVRYIRPAPGWSWNRAGEREIMSVDSGEECDKKLSVIQVIERDAGTGARITFDYLSDGEQLLLLHVLNSEGVEDLAIACAVWDRVHTLA
jgi:hypothetical protein